MTPFRIVPLAPDLADSVRNTLQAPGYGHPAFISVAAGFGPCRQCLRRFRIGIDRRILFTLDPFAGLESLPLPGPVFIHAESCETYNENEHFSGRDSP